MPPELARVPAVPPGRASLGGTSRVCPTPSGGGGCQPPESRQGLSHLCACPHTLGAREHHAPRLLWGPCPPLHPEKPGSQTTLSAPPRGVYSDRTQVRRAEVPTPRTRINGTSSTAAEVVRPLRQHVTGPLSAKAEAA